MTTAETLRAREVYRYYQPRDVRVSQPPIVLEQCSPDLEHPQAHHFLPRVTNYNTQQSFSDTALTAFAQLIALRLTAQRAIVSLIDHENEYFLAESTSTLSLIDDDGPAQNAWLSISGARVPRGASLCEQTLNLVPNQDTTAETTPWFLVPDLRLDEKMSKLDCVKGAPYLRFYCGVALTNKKGVNIGCVYVVDESPRTDISLEQGQFLIRMAATVMDHLENIRAKEDIVRVTMMSQALHAFIEGDGTMDGDWQRLKRYNLPSGAGVGFHWETNKNDGTGSYRNGKKQLGVSRTHPLFSGPDMNISAGQSPLQHTGKNQDARFNFNNSPWSSSSEVPQVPTKSYFDGVGDPVLNSKGGRDTEFANNGFSTLLHTTFSRASNLVREGMEVDGAVFFDAPFRFYQGRSTLEMDPRRSDEQDNDSESESDTDVEDQSEVRPGPRPHASSHSHHSSVNSVNSKASKSRTASGVAMEGIKSDILGFSTRHSSSWNNQNIRHPSSFAAIDQSLLTSLVRRYPLGELFVFDQDGPITPSTSIPSPDDSVVTIVDALTEEKRARRAARKRADILRLLVAFPDARQIFFVPLYDSTSGCFIGSFAWSTSATRIFSIENHLSYLVAFGHSVMSEVSGLNNLSADRAKGDFISNVSHELRSPLHGILASVEFLADTSLDGFQRNLVDTVDICGRTLLDTIEHILDFSKIKKFGQESAQSMGVVAELDVSAVIEEVLEGVYAGFEFNGLSSQGLADTTKSRTRNAHHMNEKTSTSSDEFGVSNDLLTVIIDIDFRVQWKFPTVPGTWRRLAMNIFGNALKYTHAGYIKIKLEARAVPTDPASKSGSIERTMVTLTISDSGQGMSSDFMKNKLFMPFSQEDVTAPGTGLGMSIVKQIVDLSGGRIDIVSDQSTGTEIKLSLPLENCLPPTNDLVLKSDSLFKNEDPVESVRRRVGGRTVTILGFDDVSGKSDLQLGALASLKATMKKYSTEWFGLKLVSNNEDADIAISDESAYLRDSVSETKFRILLILCSNGARRDIFPSRLHTGQIVEFVSKPCGPHRLAKALLNCLDTEENTSKTSVGELVSEEGSHIGDVPPVAAMVTAGTSSSRLIGNLQSSIGFSPATLNLIRTPSLKTASEMPDMRPLLTRRIQSASESANALETLSLGSTDTSTISSSSQTPNSSKSSIEEEDLKPGSPDASPETPRRPVMLLVEDNPVNMMLLATYMRKNKWEFEKATNGLLALEAFRERPRGFDVIFMDVSMPVMTGYESTRHIRMIETERRLAYEHQNLIQSPYVSPSASSFPFDLSSPALSPSASNSTEINNSLSLPRLKLNRPALIIALTGFSSQKDQEMAFEAGVDIFMTKPVRFREVGRILDGWMKSRESEREQGEGEGVEKVQCEEGSDKRELDEGMSGAKRSG